MYETSDIQILDPLSHIRKRPEIYLPQGVVNGSTLLCQILENILIIPGCKILVERLADWWVIGSDVEWPEGVADQVFREFVSYPEVGLWGFHKEVLVTAFARDIITFDRDSHVVIAGQVYQSDPVFNLRKRHNQLKRLTGFRMA